MAYVCVIEPEEATGALAAQYRAARNRSGRIWNIVKIMSQNAATMKSSMGLYLSIMHGPSPLSRAQRELLAVVTSQINRCHY